MITIAVDAMGGDHGLKTVVPAAIQAVQKCRDLCIILVGDQNQIKEAFKERAYTLTEGSSIRIEHASEVVEMDELPSHALRSKKDSSMRVAINLVRDNQAQACVSAGNTGALMAISRFVLKTLPGIDRPAIIHELPTQKNRTWMIDLGANVDSCAEHLFQFAVMGSALVQAVLKKSNPKIGLLNIGIEEIKGNDQVKRTAHMLSECEPLNYMGYIEGNRLFSGDVDLVVCDGFAGNVALKSSEGLASLIAGSLHKAFTAHWWSKLLGLLCKPILTDFRRRFDPGRYNGASLIGLNGLVVKSHGGADCNSFECAIETAYHEINAQVMDLTRDKIADFMNKGLML